MTPTVVQPAAHSDPKPAPARPARWTTVAQIVGVPTAVGGLCLHLMGATYSAQFYRHWGLDAAFFRLAADETVVLGYQAFLNGLAMGAVALLISTQN